MMKTIQVESESEQLFRFRIQDYAPGRCSLASQEVVKVSPVVSDAKRKERRENS